MKTPIKLMKIALFLAFLIPLGTFSQIVNTTPVNLAGSSDPIPGPGPFIDHPFTPSPITGTYHGGTYFAATKEKWGYEISDLTPGEEYTLTVYYMLDVVFGTPSFDRVGNLEMESGAPLDVVLIPYVEEDEWRIWFSLETTFTALAATDRIEIEADGTSDNSLWLFTDMTIGGGGACDDLTVTVSATEVCIGEEVTLEATSINEGDVTWDGGITSGVPFTPALGTTTYSATSTSEDDCPYSVDIIVHDLPAVTANADNLVICNGDELTLTGGGAASYIWDAGVTDGVPFVPAATATYNVVGTDINGCENTDAITVTVNDVPTVDAGVDVTICETESVTLTGAGAGVGATYTWDGGAVDGVPFAPGTTTTYTLTGTNADGCEDTDEVLVTVIPLPVIDAGVNIAVCDGESVTLTGSGAMPGDVASWDGGVVDGVTFTPLSTQVYQYTVSTPEGCTSTDALTVTVNPLPVASFTVSDNQGCFPFDVSFSSDTPGLASYEWNFGDGNTESGSSYVHTYNAAGSFDVELTVTSAEGCSQSQTYSAIDIIDPPVADFSMVGGETDQSYRTFDFTNESTGAVHYNWSFGDGSGDVTSLDATHEFPETTREEYLVTLTASNNIGCVSQKTKPVRIKLELIYFIPNAFTPDGDEFNEEFAPIFASGLDVYDYHLTILNRWGQVVFESFDVRYGWDGTYGSNGLAREGTYIWRIDFGERSSDKKYVEIGSVNLLR